MNWMASNVVVSPPRDETILPIKESPMSPNKIDGIDAPRYRLLRRQARHRRDGAAALDRLGLRA
jgi:phage terminase large subunit-like protein